jgi:hypothetical protein
MSCRTIGTVKSETVQWGGQDAVVRKTMNAQTVRNFVVLKFQPR